MEKAILKTLVYSSIFDYPLKPYEIHKWLIGTQGSLRKVENSLLSLEKKGKIKYKKGFYFLNGKEGTILKRITKEKCSKKFLIKARIVAWFLRYIPTLKLIGISGGLSLNNASPKDDIDLFLITTKKRIWISRFLVIIILDFLSMRRKVGMSSDQASGKICINILLEEDKLEQENKDIFIAHEVLQMKLLWQRDNAYSEYLKDNGWVFKLLPNWTSSEGFLNKSPKHRRKISKQDIILDYLEGKAKDFQLKIMSKRVGGERISDGALYFHPNNIRGRIIKEYKVRVKDI